MKIFKRLYCKIMNKFFLPKGTYMGFSGTVKIGDEVIGECKRWKLEKNIPEEY